MANSTTAGHRQRLRDRFISGDTTARTEEALLELLLTFAIPQKDLQPLAKELLQKFGSLNSVLSASPTALGCVTGIKSSSTVLIKLVDAFRSASKKTVHTSVDSTPIKPAQQTLFDTAGAPSISAPEPPAKQSRRHGTGLFGKCAVKDAIALLPKTPLAGEMDEIAVFLKANLPYNSVQTRARNSQYFRSQMFPDGHADLPLIQFARAFPVGQDVKDVCLYRFCRAEPLVDDFTEHLLRSKGVTGTIGRDFILDYLRKRFPGAAAADDCATAIAGGFESAGVFKRKKNVISYIPRNIPLPAFAFILHSEFPEPGMYNISDLEKNAHIRALMWKSDHLLPSLYELRNRGLISKVSEIDSVRQFTTKWTLPQIVERLAAGTKTA